MGKPDRSLLIYGKDCDESKKLKEWLKSVNLEFDSVYKEDDSKTCRFYQIEKTPTLLLIESAVPGISTYDAYLTYTGYDEIKEYLEMCYDC